MTPVAQQVAVGQGGLPCLNSDRSDCVDFGYVPTGGLNGTVLDDHGAPLAAVWLTASGPAGDVSVQSQKDGGYSFTNLAPGIYTVSSSSVTGYTTPSAQSVSVPVAGQAGPLTFTYLEQAHLTGSASDAPAPAYLAYRFRSPALGRLRLAAVAPSTSTSTLAPTRSPPRPIPVAGRTSPRVPSP